MELSGGTKLAKPAWARPLERRVRPVAKHTWTRLRTRSAAALAAHRCLLLTLKTTLAHATSPGAVSTCSASTVASHRFDQTLSASDPANARPRVCIAPRRPPAGSQRTGSPRRCLHAQPNRREAFRIPCSHHASLTRNTPVHCLDNHTSECMRQLHQFAGLTFDMSCGRKQAKPAGGRQLDGRVRRHDVSLPPSRVEMQSL